MDPGARKYTQAAIGYLVYGVIYLAGAIYLCLLYTSDAADD